MAASDWRDKAVQVAAWRHWGLVVIVCVWGAMCVPLLLGSHFIPGDSVNFNYPQAKFIVNAFRSGDVPWWNPLLFGGQPLLGDPQSMVFTPHVFLGVLAGRSFGLHLFDVTTVLCLLAGACGICRLGHGSTDNRIMPALGAIVFMIGGVASSRLQHVQEILSYSLMPLQMLGVLNICRKPTLMNAAWLSALTLVALLNPNQVVFLSAFGLLPFCLVFVCRSDNRGRACLLGILSVGAALAAAAPVLDATLEFLRISNRPSLPIGEAGGASFPFLALPGLIIPGLFGVMKPSQGLWAPNDVWQDYIYVGLFPAALLARTILLPNQTTRLAFVAAALAVFWFVFTLGLNTPLYQIIFTHVPFASGFRRPADGAFLMNFSIAVVVAVTPLRRPKTALQTWEGYYSAAAALLLVAAASMAMFLLLGRAAQLGYQADLHRSLSQFALRVSLWAVSLALLALAPARLRQTVAAPLILMLMVADLATAGHFSRLFTNRYSTLSIAQFYQPNQSASPETQADNDAVSFLISHGVKDGASSGRIEVLGGDLADNLPMTRGIATTQAYNPLSLASYANIVGTQSLGWEAKHFSRAASDYDADLYRHLGLRFVLIPRSQLTKALLGPPVISQNEHIRESFRTTGMATLAAVLDDYEVWEMRNALPKAVMQSDVDTAPVPCEILGYQNDTLRLRCSAASRTSLVVGDNDAPGWSACVNGSSAAITPYKGLLREVALPAGVNIISMTYQPVPFLRRKTCPAAS